MQDSSRDQASARRAGPLSSWPGQAGPGGRGSSVAIRSTWAQSPALPCAGRVTRVSFSSLRASSVSSCKMGTTTFHPRGLVSNKRMTCLKCVACKLFTVCFPIVLSIKLLLIQDNIVSAV